MEKIPCCVERGRPALWISINLTNKPAGEKGNKTWSLTYFNCFCLQSYFPAGTDCLYSIWLKVQLCLVSWFLHRISRENWIVFETFLLQRICSNAWHQCDQSYWESCQQRVCVQELLPPTRWQRLMASNPPILRTICLKQRWPHMVLGLCLSTQVALASFQSCSHVLT